MYKVLIIDDEPLVRIAIKSLVNWEEEGFDLQLEAAQGKEALEIITREQHISMIVTDINMPVMGGIELLRILKEMGSQIPVVVLSGYNDYNLVRQAFKLGAKDYLLKSEMTPESLIRLFRYIVEEYDWKEEVKSEQFTIEEREVVKGNYLRLLLSDEKAGDRLAIPKDLGIRLGEDSIVICQVLVDDYSQIISKYTEQSLVSFMNTVLNFIKEVLKNKGEVISISPDEYVILLGFNEKVQGVIRGEISEILNAIRSTLKNYVNIGVTIGISDIGKQVKDVNALYYQAKHKAQLRFLIGKGKNIFPEVVIEKNLLHNLSHTTNEKEILDALQNREKEKIFAVIQHSFATIKSLQIENVRQSYPYYMQLIFIISKCINELEDSKEGLTINELEVYEKIVTLETLEEINQYIEAVVKKVVVEFYHLQEDVYSKTIIGAIRFIRKNYADKELNLKKVSEEVNLSIGYLSTLFAKEVQMSFKDFITYVRIERAKELILHSKLKIYEICDEVGYSNVEHFSRVFKKVTGHSPNHFYRNREH